MKAVLSAFAVLRLTVVPNLVYWEIGGFVAAQNTVNIGRRQSEYFVLVGRIGHEAAGGGLPQWARSRQCGVRQICHDNVYIFYPIRMDTNYFY